MADAPFVSLYRRFRPGRFDEIRGQDHVVRALRSAVRDNRVSHAYLFSGPRGTGKTSSARILAKALNCEAPVDGEPCGVCTSCLEITQGNSLNVHELDAASNNGVDAMRDLVAHAGLGTPGRWKVYIVDEVHMLSTAAANALLKTLEEPPSHVVFVLATTDPQKVPPTIRSRTQHLEFRLLGAETLHDLLESVNAQAGLNLDGGAVQAAVRRGRGSARDALSALDQVVASGSSEAARPELDALLDALANGEVGPVLVGLSGLTAGGWGPQQLATEIIDDLRQVFLAALAPDLCAASGASVQRFVGLAEAMSLARVVRSIEILGHALIDMRDAPDAQVVLEIAVVRAVRPDLDSGIEALNERVAVLERSMSGAAAFPRPGAAPPPTAAAPPPPTAAAPPPPTAAAPPPPTAAPATVAPDPPKSASAAPRPAAAERPAGDVGRRPSLGAVRRSKQATNAEQGPAAAAPVEPAQPAPPGPPPAEPRAEPAPATAPGVLDRDTLTEAWGDGILRGLPARAKALFSAGRFVSVDDEGAHFALPNVAHRDRCVDMAPTVEQKLAAHFGTPVTLVLDVDVASAPVTTSGSPAASPGEPGSPGDPGAPAASGAPRDEPDMEAIDPADFTDNGPSGGTDQESEAQARLLEAFPGASEVLGQGRTAGRAAEKPGSKRPGS
ncbi:MAG TPA: DNA polymerase III subunit gamma/tau [Acidimicrobiales bacterium]|nr:DNA polymerase III subunit gamma/tau [Acidimicrobiales bacterium]